MARVPRVWVPGDPQTPDDMVDGLNDIEQTIATVQGQATGLAARSKAFAETTLTNKIRIDGATKTTGTLPVTGKQIELFGGVTIDGTYQSGNGINLYAPNGDVYLNGSPIPTDRNQAATAGIATANAATLNGSYLQFSSVTNAGASGYTLQLAGGGRSISAPGDSRYALIIITAQVTLTGTSGNLSIYAPTGEEYRTSFDLDPSVYNRQFSMTVAFIARLNASIPLNITGNGVSVSATAAVCSIR